MFMDSYCYVRSVLCILFHCVVLCTACVKMCIVLLPLGVNPIAVNKYSIWYHKYDASTFKARALALTSLYPTQIPKVTVGKSQFLPEILKQFTAVTELY
jgi:hypothetical protein